MCMALYTLDAWKVWFNVPIQPLQRKRKLTRRRVRGKASSKIRYGVEVGLNQKENL